MLQGYPENSCSIVLWNTSALEFNPNGRRINWNLPNGELNVVYFMLSSSSGIWQNPALASTLHENEFLCSLRQHKETFMFFYGAL